MSEPEDWDLAARTAEQLADWPSTGETTTFEIEKGGSGRRFFRISRGGVSIILMHYNLDRPENADFAPITDFLREHSIPVPEILARDEECGFLWIEDLGEADLWLIRNSDWQSVRRPAYRATLEAVARIHQLTESSLQDRSACELPHFQPAFDAAMYRWEQDYFFDRYAARFAEVDEAERESIRSSSQLIELIDALTALPRTLVHRDFQSQNVMLPEGIPRFIDYQGMRYGRPEYDVASLLFDPYVPFSEGERNELARYYHTVADGGSSFDEFEDRLLRCGAQRLMQALGAYGFLGIDRKQSAFLEHIPPALENLHWIAVERAILPDLAPLLKLGGNRVA